jgi:hypothetical protein
MVGGGNRSRGVEVMRAHSQGMRKLEKSRKQILPQSLHKEIVQQAPWFVYS